MLLLQFFVDFAPVRPTIGIQEKTRRFRRVTPEERRQITPPTPCLARRLVDAGVNSRLLFSSSWKGFCFKHTHYWLLAAKANS